MKRKAAWVGLSFLSGTVLLCAVEISIISLLAAALALTALALFSLPKYRVYAAAAGISFLCGVCCARAYTVFHIRPLTDLDGSVILVEGKVTACSRVSSDRYMLTVDGSSGGREMAVNFFTDRPCELYSIVRARGIASALTDTDEFPSRSYYLPRGIYLQANALTLEETGEYADPIMRGAAAFRDYTEDCLYSAMDEECAAFAAGMLCGDKSGLSDVTRTKLYRAGIGHFFAVSGTHVMIVSMLLGVLLRLFIPFRRVRTAALLLMIFLFASFAGFTPSVVRAGIMSAALCCSQLLHRQTDILSSLGICAVLMCGVNPYICISESFVCSFGACLALGAFVPPLTRKLRGSRFFPIFSSVIASAAVTAVLMPYMAFKFSEVSLISPVTNLLIVPLLSAALTLILTAMLIGGSILPARLILHTAELLIKLSLRLTDFFAGLSFSSVGCSRRWLLLSGAAVLIAALCYSALRHRPGLFALLTAAVFLLMWSVQSIAGLIDRSAVRVRIFPGSKGLCAAVRCGSSCTLLDIGSGGSSYAVQQYISSNAVITCPAAFVTSDYRAEFYLSAPFPVPERIYSENSKDAFTEGMTAGIDSFTVTRTGSGFDVSAGGSTLSLSVSKAELNRGGEQFTVSGGAEFVLS